MRSNLQFFVQFGDKCFQKLMTLCRNGLGGIRIELVRYEEEFVVEMLD